MKLKIINKSSLFHKVTWHYALSNTITVILTSRMAT